jgi:hypothetical protein
MLFTEIHNLSEYGDTFLTFLKSTAVQAYPCGNRRGLADLDGNSATLSDLYNIPFDPEARLNTEANNRKHSSLNGFDQSYLHLWNEGIEAEEEGELGQDGYLQLVVAGYLFNIRLIQGYRKPTEFASKLLALLENSGIPETDIEGIYANIRLEETPLFSGTSLMTNTTSVLKAQTDDVENLSLDLLKSNVQLSDVTNPDNYYFSGLSFSTKPIADLESEVPATRTNSTMVINEKTQHVFSLRILDRIPQGMGFIWQIHEPARLPKITHGNTVDSVVLGDLLSNNITSTNITNTSNIATGSLTTDTMNVTEVTMPETGEITRGGKGLIQLDIANIAENKYQLQFRNTVNLTAPEETV